MITEKLIISQQKLDEINKMDRTERIKTIKSILSDPKYIPNQSQLKNYLTYLVKEVDARGFDTIDNPLLIFATNNKGGNPITEEQASLIQQLALKNILNKQLLENTASWLYNPRAYEGSPYKIKALVFLTNKNQYSKYGDNPEGLIQEIIQTNDDERIKELLDNWQTREEERSRTNTRKAKDSDDIRDAGSLLTTKEALRKKDALKQVLADGTQDNLLTDWIKKNIDVRDNVVDILRKMLRRQV